MLRESPAKFCCSWSGSRRQCFPSTGSEWSGLFGGPDRVGRPSKLSCLSRLRRLSGATIRLLASGLGWCSHSCEPRRRRIPHARGVEHHPNPDANNLMVAPEGRLNLLRQLSFEGYPTRRRRKDRTTHSSRRETLLREQLQLSAKFGRLSAQHARRGRRTVQLAIPESSFFR